MTAGTFGAALAHHRRAVGLSQNRLAHEAGCDPSYVNLLEANRNAPSRAVAAALGRVVGAEGALLRAAGYLPTDGGADPLMASLERLVADPHARAVLEAFAERWPLAHAVGLFDGERAG